MKPVKAWAVEYEGFGVAADSFWSLDHAKAWLAKSQETRAAKDRDISMVKRARLEKELAETCRELEKLAALVPGKVDPYGKPE